MLKGVLRLVYLYFGSLGSTFRRFSGMSSGLVAGFCEMKVKGAGESRLTGIDGVGDEYRDCGGG
jgi:hypothetical protein